jgi:hypothetical protein
MIEGLIRSQLIADADILDKAQRYANMIMMLAEEMNLQSEHDYIEDTHMTKFKELAVDESMVPPSARMMQYAT